MKVREVRETMGKQELGKHWVGEMQEWGKQGLGEIVKFGEV